MGMAQLRQGKGIAFASNDGCEHGHPRGARQVTHDLGACAVHLLSRLRPMLHRVRAGGEEPLAVASRAAQPAELSGGAEGRGAESVGVPAVQPWAVEPIGCGSSGGALGLTGIDQADLQATGLQECEEGHPGDAGRCHGDGDHATVKEPVGEGVEVDGEGAETAHGLRVAPRGHGHPVLGFADIDPRSMGVGEWE